MAQTIKLRRSSVQGKVPHTSSLALGELAINTFDGRAFIHRDKGGNDSTIQHLITTNAETTGSINLIGSITASDDLIGNNKAASGTGGEVSFIKDFVTDISYEDTAFYNHDTINVFAGAHKWATQISASNVFGVNRTTHLPTHSIGNEPFEPGGNTFQPYFNNAEDDMQIYIDHTNEPIRWRGIVGIQFTSTSWRANKVIIEGYSGSGEWIEAKNTTNNKDAVVVGYFNNILSAGIERVRITLGDPESSNKYIRISKIFGYDYKGVSSGQDDAVATGTYYVNKFDDSAHYSNIYPASGNVDLGRNGDRYRNVYAEDVTIDDWGSVSESLASIQTAGGVNGSGATNKVAIWTDANTLTSDTNLHFDSVNDRLGIGTDAPSEALELSAGKKIKLESNTDGTGSILIITNDEDTAFSTFNNSATGPQQFVLKHNLGNTELINRRGDLILSSSTQRIGINAQHPTVDLQVGGDISASGNFHVTGDVGIGTISPTAKLHISSSVSDAIRIETEGSANQQGPQLYIHGNKQDGAPSRTTIIELKGDDISRARGIEFTATDNTIKKWYAGTVYNQDGYTIGYTSHDNTQGPEYKASSSLFIDHNRNISASGDLTFNGGPTIGTNDNSSITIEPEGSLFLGNGNQTDLVKIGRESGGPAGRVEIHANSATIAAKFESETIEFNHPVTASSTISASGNLFASLSDANGSYNNTVMYDTTSGQFYYTGSYGGGGGGNTVSAVLATELSASLVSDVGGVANDDGFDAGATLESVLRAILVQFVPPTFSSFVITGLDSTLEVGSTEQSTINGGTFTTASSTSNGTGFENNGGSFALALTGNATNDGAISATYSGNGSISFTSPSSVTIKRTTAGNVLFNLTGTDQENNVTVKSDQASFRFPIFYGGSANDGSGADDAALADILADISSSITSISNTTGITLLSTLTSTYGQQTLINSTNSNLPSNTKISLPASVAEGSNYTYIVIPSTFGNLTNMLKNGVQDEFGTMTNNGAPLFTANHERFSGVNTEYNVFRSTGQIPFAEGDTLTFND